MKNSDSKKSKVQQEIIELKKKLESDTLTHRESELALRKVNSNKNNLPNIVTRHPFVSQTNDTF